MPKLLPLLLMPMATMLELGLALALFVRGLPRRPHFGLRVAVVLALVAVFTVLASWVGFVQHPELMHSHEPLTVGLTFGVVALCMPLVVLACHDVSPWTAVWCAAAAYTLQNLASGTDELLQLMFMQVGFGSRGDPLMRSVAFDASLLLVYGLFCLLSLRRLRESGVAEVEDRRMLLMLVMVVLVVIVIDAIAKQLFFEGVPFALIAWLRLAHGLTCSFVLYAGYEMLFSRRMEQDLAVLSAQAAERERQYELSRETLAAVNARVHDIRHQVLRSLEAGTDATLDRRLLAQVAREVDVYDLMVRSGNDALDTVLTERALIAHREGIELSCIADGSALSSLQPAQTYSLVGALLDAALSGARRSGADEVVFDARRRGDMALVHLEWVGELPKEPELAMARQLVERGSGTLATLVRDGVAHVNVMLS